MGAHRWGGGGSYSFFGGNALSAGLGQVAGLGKAKAVEVCYLPVLRTPSAILLVAHNPEDGGLRVEPRHGVDGR